MLPILRKTSGREATSKADNAVLGEKGTVLAYASPQSNVLYLQLCSALNNLILILFPLGAVLRKRCNLKRGYLCKVTLKMQVI